MALTSAQIAEILTDLPALLDLYSTFEAAIVATKGETPTARDFDILIALAPKLKTLAVAIEAQLAAKP
jgi:hypothetical protein